VLELLSRIQNAGETLVRPTGGHDDEGIRQEDPVPAGETLVRLSEGHEDEGNWREDYTDVINPDLLAQLTGKGTVHDVTMDDVNAGFEVV